MKKVTFSDIVTINGFIVDEPLHIEDAALQVSHRINIENKVKKGIQRIHRPAPAVTVSSFRVGDQIGIFLLQNLKFPHARIKKLISSDKNLFWLFLTIISVLVVTIISLIIVSSSKWGFVTHPLVSYHVGCTPHTTHWHVEENGATGTIKVIYKI